jgi:mercuric ion binding protein
LIPVLKHLAVLSLTLGLFASPALAAEKTVTLAVEGMYCASCPFIVQQSLTAVPGVEKVEVSFENQTATVTFDDAKADAAALVKATTDAGYPSQPKS